MCGAPRRAAVDAARSRSPLTSGSACGRALRAGGWRRRRSRRGRPSARAPPRGAGARTRSAVRSSPIGGGDQAVRQALAVGVEQAGGQQRVARRAQLADAGRRPPPRPRAAARRRRRPPAPRRPPRSRAHSVGQPPADRRCGRSRRRAARRRRPRRSSSGPCVAIWRPSSPSSHGLPPTARWQSRQTTADASGARRRISCVAPRGVSALRMQHGRRPHAAEQAQQIRSGARVVGARADRDQQRQVVDAPGEVGEHLQRRAVGPLRVVDDERQRSPVGDGRAQPQHAVGEEHGGVAAGDGAVEEQRARGRSGPVEQLRALLAGGLAQRRLQQGAHDPEAGSGARVGPARRGARGSRCRRRTAPRARAGPSCPGPPARRARPPRPRRRPAAGPRPRAPPARPRAR